ncbi:MAG: bifunctional diaminohydroxyphosphoribosylaminopyrimidine deaminase/5-amino-6-(5-phosphoribosylamino)uracil reductase RibD [Bacteroidales bacterium]|nr:bifunctional diaminohydroxyphosphoribosylaminopyrimidine deaminase/5-amino-6-(5-phosphoribosylamino)uracil reductase RibD [Candidatus Liminaster caballi]
MTLSDTDIKFMHQAMQLAEQGRGHTDPNPLVGAVIVLDGQVIAQGWHHRYGDLHAERDAFRMADSKALSCVGATMYVTLEPCCHHGHQPPCTDAIIEHHISRVVIGLGDPNPLVAGKGIKLLNEAGIETLQLSDCDDAEARKLHHELEVQNRAFLHYITTGRPWVTAKWAMTLDGKICTRTGHSQWISGEESRRMVHHLRRQIPAILCGIGTVLADDPMLNCRLESKDLPKGMSVHDVRQPVRIIADRQARIPLDSKLAASAHEQRTVVAYAEGADLRKLHLLNKAGVETWCCPTPEDLLERAGKEHISGILVEGGGTLNESLLRASLIDEVYAFIAPKIVGGADAKTPVEGLGLSRMSDAVTLDEVSTTAVGQDILVHGFVKHNTPHTLCSQE